MEKVHFSIQAKLGFSNQLGTVLNISTHNAPSRSPWYVGIKAIATKMPSADKAATFNHSELKHIQNLQFTINSKLQT